MTREASLEVFANEREQYALIEDLMREQAVAGDPLRILEAGCGRSWPYDLSGVRYTLEGVDIDTDALESRVGEVCDLHVGIHGDLCSVELDTDAYDIIYCAYVLEHVERADLVLRNFVRWARPGGLIILVVPDSDSVQGFFTRATPFWFHVLYYRLVLGSRVAGWPGYGPYPTFFHPIISREGIRSLCDEDSGLLLVDEIGLTATHNPRGGLARLLLSGFKRLASIISMGALTDTHTNLLYVLRKRGCQRPGTSV